MFDLVTLNDAPPIPLVAMVHGTFHNILSAALARKVSGDVIVEHGTNKIVKNSAWLWEWEKHDPNSYAHRLILS